MRALPHRGLRALLIAAVAIIGAAASGAQAQAPSRADADAMQGKLERILAAAESPRASNSPPLLTRFSEREINAYFEYYGESFLQPGIGKPRATLLDDGRVVARATVDLDAVRLSRERSLLDPLAYLQGSLEVVATGAIAGSGGRGVIRFESATVAGVSVPKSMAQELLKFYTQTPQRPNGFQFDEPFPLPLRAQAVSAGRGSITVTQ
jgi:hypothetical protein